MIDGVFVLTVFGAPAKHVGAEYISQTFGAHADRAEVLEHVSYLCDNVFTTASLA